MQQDYQRALDAYDNAKMSLDAVTRPEESGTSLRSWRTGATRSRASRRGSRASRCPQSVHPASSIPRTPLLPRRHMGASRRRSAIGAGVSRRRRTGACRRRSLHPHRAGWRPARSLLGRRSRLRAMGAGLLQPVEGQRHVLRHADRRHVVRWYGQHVLRSRRGRRRSYGRHR